MALLENDLFGEIDRVQVAISRLKAFEPPEGYYVADSGGKDSEVVIDLVKRSGVKADFHHNLTTIDHPETVRHIKNYHPFTIIHHPDMPLLKRMAEIELTPPTRVRRWCCRHYKERGGDGRRVVTGIRSAESTKRAGRRMIEQCRLSVSRTFLHPIIDWSDADVWEYIDINKLIVNPLYSMGFKRVGCVLCPMNRDTERDRLSCPKLYEAWHKAILRLYDNMVLKGRKVIHKNGEDFWRWWLNRDSHVVSEDQTVLFE